jgi:hypothetical protein
MATAELEGGVPQRRYRHARIDALLGAAALSSLVFIWLVAWPAFGPARLPMHEPHLGMLIGHVAGGTVMLLVGALALRIGLTKAWFRWHRPVGFTYLAGGTIASVSALVRSFDTAHTPGMATGTLAAVWLAFAAMAWRAVRNKKYEQHREWMIRSYVAAWTFVFCRFWSRAMPAEVQGSEDDMIWMTWVVPILLCEICLQWSRGAAVKRGTP